MSYTKCIYLNNITAQLCIDKLWIQKYITFPLGGGGGRAAPGYPTEDKIAPDCIGNTNSTVYYINLHNYNYTQQHMIKFVILDYTQITVYIKMQKLYEKFVKSLSNVGENKDIFQGRRK